MKKYILIGLIFIGVLAAAVGTFYFLDKNTDDVQEIIEKKESKADETDAKISDDQALKFSPDPGIRIQNAALPKPSIENSTFYLLYEGVASNKGNFLGLSKDGLSFESKKITNNYEHNPHRLKMPDGTWKMYGFDKDGNMTSESSKDGVSFTRDLGIRYKAQKNDKGKIGIYETFLDSKDGAVLLYIGDMFGMNNIRRAYSPPEDKGMNFIFDNDDVLNDKQYGGGSKSYVDQKILPLPDGRFRLFAMRQGKVYSFISPDDGKTFQLEGLILEPNDFRDIEVGSLHDPWVIRLPDGRYRMYVAAKVGKGPPKDGPPKDGESVIISAATPRP